MVLVVPVQRSEFEPQDLTSRVLAARSCNPNTGEAETEGLPGLRTCLKK